jgi:hypothetical protein
MGLAYGLIYNSQGIIDSVISRDTNYTQFKSIKQLTRSISILLIPIIYGYVLSEIEVKQSFTILMVSFILIAIAFLLVRIGKIQQDNVVLKILLRPFKDRSIRNISFINVVMGISFAFGWGLMDIIVLESFGSVGSWVNIAIGKALITIFLSILIRIIGGIEVRKTRVIILLMSVIYAVAPLNFLLNQSAESFLIFIFASVAYGVITDTLTRGFVYNIEQQDSKFPQRELSYQVFNDFYIVIGQILPIIFLFILPQSFRTLEVLIVTLVITSSFPFLSSFTYKETRTRSYF